MQDAYVYRPNGQGHTKLNNDFFERLPGTQATTRNRNTIGNLFRLTSS